MNVTSQNTESRAFKIGYYISFFGIFILLFWIGIFKFTPTEAASVKPLVENHFLTFFIYDFMSVQAVSNSIGVIEIITALLLLSSLKFVFIRKYIGMAMTMTFLVTLSYLFTTPGIWKSVDGVYIPDFFILKDLMLLGFSVMLIGTKNE